MSYYNQDLTQLPQLPNTLTGLFCWNNRLTKLPEQLPNSLIHLSCENNRLTMLPDHLPNTLTTLLCWNNRLTRLPERLPNSLTWLYYGNNPFLFNWKNNLQKWINQNITSFNNYKILVTLESIKKNIHGYFCRDINRLCNKY